MFYMDWETSKLKPILILLHGTDVDIYFSTFFWWRKPKISGKTTVHDQRGSKLKPNATQDGN